MFNQFHYTHIVDVQEPQVIKNLAAVDIAYIDGSEHKSKRVAVTIDNSVNLNEFVLKELCKLPRIKVASAEFNHEAVRMISAAILKILSDTNKKPNRIIVSQNVFSRTFCEWLNVADICTGIEVLIANECDNMVFVGYKGDTEGDASLFYKSNVDKIGFFSYNVEKFYKAFEIQ